MLLSSLAIVIMWSKLLLFNKSLNEHVVDIQTIKLKKKLKNSAYKSFCACNLGLGVNYMEWHKVFLAYYMICSNISKFFFDVAIYYEIKNMIFFIEKQSS